jgi:hypothetical protein
MVDGAGTYTPEAEVLNGVDIEILAQARIVVARSTLIGACSDVSNRFQRDERLHRPAWFCSVVGGRLLGS